MNRLDELGLDDVSVEMDGNGVGTGGDVGGSGGSVYSSYEGSWSGEGGGANAGSGAASEFMAAFFERVDAIKEWLSVITRNITLISEQHGLSLSATSAEEAADCSEQLERLMGEVNTATTSVRTGLKELERDNRKFSEKHRGTAEDRIRTNTHGTLTRKFISLMGRYQEVQTEFKNRYKDRVERQVRIVKPDATAEEVDEVVDGSGPNAVFSEQLVRTPGHTAARNALADIQERHQDILRLEESLAQLHQLFVDMAVLVESQGELLDQIEHLVAQSVQFTDKGVGQLVLANKYERKARKKMCCIIVVVLCVLAVILGPVLGVTLSKA